MRQLSQRITTRYHLTPLSLDEVGEYIAYRLKIAKGSPAIFSAAAIRQVYRLSEGVPRLINILCDRALLAAFNDDVDIVQSKHINIAAAETQPQSKKTAQRSDFLRMSANQRCLRNHLLQAPKPILPSLKQQELKNNPRKQQR